ncbi:MAG TPA: sigma-70 family RNA polymerase sigma factor [Vicinamibacterales bacterium]|nr:sigma-70 family RNA polymerase sigma factor [Vicinamibacterales bacterium]
MPDKDDQLFLENLPVIDAAVASVCRRYRLTADEADDFAAEVRLRFIERNYEPLREFKGRSTLRTYLIVVVTHLFLDYRNRLWGKWRPSAEATRIGPVAIQFEKLVVRDGWSVAQAMEQLVTNQRVAPEELRPLDRLKIAERPPSREMVPEREADLVASRDTAPDDNIVRAEQDFLARRVQAALDRARQALPAEERLILRMRFDDSMSVADIARALRRDQKRLYRTIERLFVTLREHLEADGISKAEMAALFGSGAFDNPIEAPDSSERPRAGTPAATLGIRGRRG